MTRVSAGEGQSAEDDRAELTVRLPALVEAHGLVFVKRSQNGIPGKGAEVRRLAEAVLRPMAEEDRMTPKGHEVALGPRKALNAALLLHELGTDAVKLGGPAGRVRLRWRDDGRHGALDWQESDGPELRPPERRGLGTRLIEMMVACSMRENAALEHRADGLRCRVDMLSE